LLASLALAPSIGWAQTTPAGTTAPTKPAAQAPAKPAGASPGAEAQAKPETAKPDAPRPTFVESWVEAEVSPRVLDPSLNDTLRAVRARGVLRACVALSSPWTISDGEQKLSGYAVDIARQLAEDINADAQFVLSAMADMIDRLHRGECDIIPGGFSPTPQRALFAHFSTPTLVLDVSVVGKRESMGTWGKAGALDAMGTTIGVIDGTADADVARRLYPKAKLEPFAESADLVKALADGKVMAAVMSSPLTEFVVEKSGEAFAKLAEPVATQRDGLAVRRGDLEFLAYLNTWVQARRDDRWIDTHARKWFKDFDWTPPCRRAATRCPTDEGVSRALPAVTPSPAGRPGRRRRQPARGPRDRRGRW
jgi:polar amino acid transport system substrate-binding protein